jgi:N-acetylmuramoyl-L-alanine amidase
MRIRRYRGRHLKPRPVGRGPATIGAATAVWMAGSHAAHAATHVVRRGETLSGIAARYGTTVERLAAVNGLADPDVIIAGRRLRVPGSVTTATGSHRVAAGETLSAIAARYGTSVPRLARINHLANPNFIVAGTTLTVPGGAGTTTLPAPPPAAAVGRVQEALERSASAYGVDTSLAKAVAWQESGWRQDVVSSAGAVGVMQVMPDTADFVNGVLGEGRRDPRNVDDNIALGVRYLRHMIDTVPGRRRAVAAYLTGPGNVGNKLTKEQRHYVDAVMSHRSRFR